jgi:pimeloyl-ACP methyl ester carboxylesterase
MRSTVSEVIILHGWSRESAPSAKWLPIVELLRAAGAPTSVLKLPGFELPLEQPWGIDEYVDWLAKQLAQKQNIVLVGHSFGGHLAATYAARYPKQVQKLVLIASAGFRSRSLSARLKRNGFYHLAKLGKKISSSDTLRHLLHRLAGERDYLEANTLMRETMRKVLEHEVDAELPNITAETTIIWGENDGITPMEFADRLRAGVPNTKLQLIAGGRHGVPFTHPERVSALILEAVHA